MRGSTTLSAGITRRSEKRPPLSAERWSVDSMARLVLLPGSLWSRLRRPLWTGVKGPAQVSRAVGRTWVGSDRGRLALRLRAPCIGRRAVRIGSAVLAAATGDLAATIEPAAASGTTGEVAGLAVARSPSLRVFIRIYRFGHLTAHLRAGLGHRI